MLTAAPKFTEVTFKTTIDCKNCVKKVEANLPFEPGIEDMKVSIKEKTVWVKFNPEQNSVEGLKAAIERLGYKAEEYKAEKKECTK